MVSHQFSTVQFPSHQFIRKVRSVHFGAWGPSASIRFQLSSGSVQIIEPPIVWEEQRNNSRSPPAEIPVRRPGVCRPGMEDGAHFWLCLLSRPGCGVVSEWGKLSSKSLNESSFSSVRLPDRVDCQFVQFSLGHGGPEPKISSFSSVNSVQFTNSSGPDPNNL